MLRQLPHAVVITTDEDLLDGNEQQPLEWWLEQPSCYLVVPTTCSIGTSKVKRTQTPLDVALAMTVHKVQGATMRRALIDVNSTIVGSQVALRYVALSRVTSLDGVRLLHKPLKSGFLMGAVKSDILAADVRLRGVDASTAERFQELFAYEHDQ